MQAFASMLGSLQPHVETTNTMSSLSDTSRSVSNDHTAPTKSNNSKGPVTRSMARNQTITTAANTVANTQKSTQSQSFVTTPRVQHVQQQQQQQQQYAQRQQQQPLVPAASAARATTTAFVPIVPCPVRPSSNTMQDNVTNSIASPQVPLLFREGHQYWWWVQTEGSGYGKRAFFCLTTVQQNHGTYQLRGKMIAYSNAFPEIQVTLEMENKHVIESAHVASQPRLLHLLWDKMQDWQSMSSFHNLKGLHGPQAWQKWIRTYSIFCVFTCMYV